jgi:hypothetical protein
MLIKADTANAQIHRFGTMQNITPTVDEITTMTPEAVSDFLYNFLHARGKNRLINNVNGERVNFTTWATNCVVTSNHALEDKLFSKKSTPDGEAARLLEFKYRPPIQFSKEETDEVFNPLRSNYGVAGEQYMQYVIQIAPTIENQIAEMQRAVDRAAVLTQRERHWSATAATILTAGFFARNSKVLDFVTKEDFKRVYDWAVNMLREKRGLAYKASADHKLALGSFLSEHLNDTLIIDSGITLRGAANGSMPAIPPVPSKEPKGKLYIRYEPDTQLLYLNRMKFRQHCSERQVAYAAVLDQLQKDGLLVGEKKFRMGKGLQVSEPENVVVVRYVDTDGVLDENNGSTSKD